MALSALHVHETALLRITTQVQAADKTCAPACAANSINFCKFTTKTISLLLVSIKAAVSVILSGLGISTLTGAAARRSRATASTGSRFQRRLYRAKVCTSLQIREGRHAAKAQRFGRVGCSVGHAHGGDCLHLIALALVSQEFLVC